MSEGCEKTSVFGEEEAGREYKRGLLNHRGSEQGVVVHPGLQHSHHATVTETPTPPWKKLREEAHLHAASPGCLALSAPGEAGSTGRLGQGERHSGTAGSGVEYSKRWEVPSHALGSTMLGAVGGWWGQPRVPSPMAMAGDRARQPIGVSRTGIS